MKLNKCELTLIFLIIVGTLIRFYNIGFQAMNYDENFTISFVPPSLSLLDIFIKTLTTDFSPPFYYIAAHYSMILFGSTATAIRIPSAICGILFIPIIYFIGKEYKDELYGILLAGFSTIFYNAIFYSRYGRAYTMELMFFSITFYFFMRLLKGDKKAGIWFGIFALCSAWTHLYVAVPLAIMVVYLLWNRKAYDGIIIFAVGAIPLLNYINLVLFTRCIDSECFFSGTNAFGATPMEIIFLTPMDIFAYSGIIVFPILVYMLWTHRDELLYRIIALISGATWASMLVLSTKTPIILHYAIFLVPMLLIVLIRPFYDAIKKDEVPYALAMCALLIIILELTQIYFIVTMQRMG